MLSCSAPFVADFQSFQAVLLGDIAGNLSVECCHEHANE
jgi:hypothetical protein